MNNKDNELVDIALQKYDLQVKSVSFLIEETNDFYKVEDHQQNLYVLKVYQEESSSIDDNLVEVFFLKYLTENSDLLIPTMIQAKDGKYIQQIVTPNHSKPRRVALFSWLEGEDLHNNETESLFIKLGELTAKLHQTMKGVSIPPNISPKKWNKVFFYAGEEAVYRNENYESILSQEYFDLMDKIIPFLDEALSNYYKENENQLLLIHADLNPWNIKVLRDELRILDFEDALLGLPVHDIAIMLYYYDYEEDFNLKEVKNLFLKGYEMVCPPPSFTDYDLDLLMTARRVNFMNYILLVSDEPQSFIEKSIPRVKDFIRRYNIVLD
ncbi:phosphotransferase enzyme family protein [Ornithinibacillus xuwenensis]|uniref:Phosphotransferase n=1 Tax=Ornithinibacillus xuwenensis TaxID=3144668 RepID=A0ABU9XF23_9BACI